MTPLKESFNIFKKKSALLIHNKPKEKLDFEYSAHNEHETPFDVQHFLEHEPTLNGNDQKKAVEEYKRDSFHINGALWGNEMAKKSSGHHIEPLHNLLKSAPKASSDFHVYTGVSTTNIKFDGDIHIPAFTSTSPDHRIAGLFANNFTTEEMPTENGSKKMVNIQHVIKIHVKKGQHVGGYIGDMATRKHEKEFLINKGHTLHFNGTKEDHVVHDGGMVKTPVIVRVHHATITMDDEK